MARIGFVGLGVMGGGIAGRLLDAGHEVTGYNRTRGKAAAARSTRGMAWAETPREAAERSDIVFSMVTDTRRSQAITQGPDGILAGLAPGQDLCRHEHGQPGGEPLAGRAGRSPRGATCSTPRSRAASITLEEGKLSVMVGGDAAAFERARPLLRDIGPTVTHVGGNGQAVLMKIATNLSLAVQMLAFSEGVLLAEKGGISRERRRSRCC